MKDLLFNRIEEKVLKGEPLSREEGVAIFRCPELLRVGEWANQVREKMHGDDTFFVVNRHINPTNLCVNRCRFCAFYRRGEEADAYALTMEQILSKAQEAYDQGAKELHIVGGLHPHWPYGFYLDVVRTLKNAFPDMHVKAYTAVEVDHLASISGKRVEKVLEELKEAGLDSMPGGGAEVFSVRVRKILCPQKTPPERWLRIHAAAHDLGIPTNATMLYGHVESVVERVDHLIALRELEERHPGFLAFVSLAFHPENTAVELPGVMGTTGRDDLVTIAAARLILHNIPHIKSYWIMLGEKIAQTALWFGSDDLEGTVVDERITHAAGASSPRGLSKERIVGIIRDAGRVPVERDALYNEVKRYG